MADVKHNRDDCKALVVGRDGEEQRRGQERSPSGRDLILRPLFPLPVHVCPAAARPLPLRANSQVELQRERVSKPPPPAPKCDTERQRG